MLDTLAVDTYKAADPLLAPEQVQRIDRVTRSVNTVGAFDRLLSVYDATERLQPRGYKGGLDRFVEDLTLDIAAVPRDARRVLAMAQGSLTKPELKAVFNVFQQAKGFWRGLLEQSKTDVAVDAGDLRLNERMRSELARYQQRLAQLIYGVGLLSEDSSEVRTLELMRTFADRLSSHLEGTMKNYVLTDVDNKLNAAFVQAAQMRMFQDH